MSEDGHTRVLIADMSTYLAVRSDVLPRLAEFYCSVWPDAPWFEFAKCPECGRYYSRDEVIHGLATCVGGNVYLTGPDMETKIVSRDKHKPVKLQQAWCTEPVEDMIRGMAERDDTVGVVAVDAAHNGMVVGFSWLFLRDMKETEEALNHTFGMGSEPAVYYSELAVKNESRYRGKGWGKTMVDWVIEKSRERYAGRHSVLRTHRKSVAYVLFGRAGYRTVEHTDVNVDRMIMVMPDIAQAKTMC